MRELADTGKSCAVEGCDGAAIASSKCLAHVDRARELERILDSAVRSGDLTARGVHVDNDLLARILTAAPTDKGGRPRLEGMNFSEATFDSGAQFVGVSVAGDVSFSGAKFADAVVFDDSEFDNRVSFGKARFGAKVSFQRAKFGHRVSFAGAEFGDEATFDWATFGDHTSLAGEASFGNLASFIGTRFGSQCRFDHARFGERTCFRKAAFGPGASFRRTVFGDKASFELATFAGEASFSRASFGDEVRFADATFENGISFRDVRFGDQAGFQRAILGDRAWFSDSELGTGASFAGTTFRGRTAFARVVFRGRSSFEDATFSGRVRFDRAIFRDRASFRLATFERARTFGPLLALGLLTLDQASFLQRTDIQICSDRFVAVRGVFPAGVDLRVRWAHIAVDLAEFGAPSLLTASTPFVDLDEQELATKLEGRSERPCLTSMRRASVADLIVSDIDLSTCRFVGAHNLDRLRLEGTSEFSSTPRWRGTQRQIIVEEEEWRATRPVRKWRKWPEPDATFPIEQVERTQRLAPHAIAGIYRALRKGREDQGDAPGAADFYYGEMEMRRHDSRTSRGERTILWLYWLVSGYGLRSVRALVALFATIVVFAVLFWWVGLTPQPSFTRALLFSAESTSSLFRVPETPDTTLTQLGEAFQIVLRLLGPLFFGLALLSLRGRVKR